nr:disease resistance protein RPV1 [Ziziphus jujuba var. spinosa]
MHNLIHDLATQVAGIECAMLPLDRNCINKKTRHISFGFCVNTSQPTPSALSQTSNRIRTILLPSQPWRSIEGIANAPICKVIASNFKFLCTLDMHNSRIKKVSDSIGSLMHLSEDTNIDRHKGKVGDLKELMLLNNLRGELEITNLGQTKDATDTNLKEKQHLRFLTLDCLPPLDQFPSLKSLRLHDLPPMEYISNESFSSSIVASLPPLEQVILKELPNLKGWWKDGTAGEEDTFTLQFLHIEECKELDMSNADIIMWQALKSLRYLYLVKLPQLESLPEGHQHVTTLEELQIEGCNSLIAIPEWISNLSSLKELHISYCPILASLLEGI